MLVIKRDGRAVNYDRSKIILAIQKANSEVAKRSLMRRSRILSEASRPRIEKECWSRIYRISSNRE